MRETWYVLEDGTAADPNGIVTGEDGVMRNKAGIAVAIGPHGPLSTGVDVDDAPKASDAPAPRDVEADGEKPKGRNREMKASGSKKYQTR